MLSVTPGALITGSREAAYGRQSGRVKKEEWVSGDPGENTVQTKQLVLSNAAETSLSKKYPMDVANSNFFVIQLKPNFSGGTGE